MSGVTGPTAPHVPGPFELRIVWLWNQAWQLQGEGKDFGFYPAQASAELSDWETKLSTAPSDAIQDFANAKSLDRSHRNSFQRQMEQQKEQREQIVSLRSWLLDASIKMGFYVLQSLGLANGAAALGALTYLGQHTGSPLGSMVAVLVLASLGFLFTILSALASTTRMQPAIQILLELSLSNLSETDRNQKAKDLQAIGNKMTRWPRFFGWLSLAMLILALLIGTWTLLGQPPIFGAQSPEHLPLGYQ